MPAIDLSALPPIAIERITETFMDPRCPGVSFTFTFGLYPADCEADALFVGDLARRLEEKYVKRAVPILAPGGARIPVESSLCVLVAAFVQAESAIPSESLWTPEQWFQFSVLAPHAWDALQAWYYEKTSVIRPAADENENESGAPTLPNG